MKHDVIIIGDGESGTALLYTLSKYTNVTNIGQIEMYSDLGQVKTLHDRYPAFGQLFPKLKMVAREDIGKIEPRVLEGRDPDQELLALVTEDGYTVDFRRLSHSFAENAKAVSPDISI